MITRIARTARRQLNLATYRQLTQAGIPAATISGRSRRGGPWQRLLPRVYLLQTGPPDGSQRALSAVLYAAHPSADPLSGATAALTGGAALALLGIRDAPPEPLDVLVRSPRSVTPAGRVRPASTARRPATIHVSGVPSSRPVRAAADFAARTDDPDLVRSVLANVVQGGWCHPHDLHAELRAGRIANRPAARAAAGELVAGVRSIAEGRARDTLSATDLPAPAVERPPPRPGRRVPRQPRRVLARRGRGAGDRFRRVPLHARLLAGHAAPAAAAGVPRGPGGQYNAGDPARRTGRRDRRPARAPRRGSGPARAPGRHGPRTRPTGAAALGAAAGTTARGAVGAAARPATRTTARPAARPAARVDRQCRCPRHHPSRCPRRRQCRCPPPTLRRPGTPCRSTGPPRRRPPCR